MKKWLFFLPLLALVACDKGETVEYYVSCNRCRVSYWTEGKTFVPRVDVSGEFRHRFEPEDDDKILVAAQNDTVPDVLRVSITIDGKKVAEEINEADVLYLVASAKVAD